MPKPACSAARNARLAGLLAVAGASLLLVACQTTETRQQQLARICADPSSMRADSFYFSECVSYNKLTPDQRRQLYMTIAPE